MEKTKGEAFGERMGGLVKEYVVRMSKSTNDRVAALEARVSYLEGLHQQAHGGATAEPTLPSGPAPPVSDGSKKITRLPRERKRKANG